MSSYNQTSQIMRKVPVGGTGALIERPNSFHPREKKVPTTFYSAPAVSSLPYLAEQVKYKDNETILMLSADIAKQKEIRTANYIYSDKDEALLEDNLGNDMVKVEKYKEPSTEDMLRKYLTEELGKRNEEKQSIEAKRITGVDKSIEEFRTQQEDNKKVAFQNAVEAKQQASEKARRYYIEEALKRKQFGQTGFEAITTGELFKRLSGVEVGREAKPLEVLEKPIQTIGMPTPDQRNINKLSQLMASGVDQETLNDELFRLYKIDMRQIERALSTLSPAQIDQQLMNSGLTSYLSSRPTKAEKLSILKYHRLSQDPKIRNALEFMRVPAPFINSGLPEQSKRMVDKIIEYNELANEPRDSQGRKIKPKKEKVQVAEPLEELGLPAENISPEPRGKRAKKQARSKKAKGTKA